jgi:hypothetical protein
MVVEDGQRLTLALPDDTRDHQVRFCWMGSASKIYASAGAGPPGTGNGTLITAGDPEGALSWTPAGVPPAELKRMKYNDAIKAVVGDDLFFLTAVDAKRVVYRVSLSGALPKPTISSIAAWSNDGRRFAVVSPSKPNNTITIFDGDHGRELAKVTVGGHVDALRWSPARDGERMLAIVSGPAFDDPRHVHLISTGRIARTIDLPLARQSLDLEDARTVDWSPAGDRLALLRRDGDIEIVELSGAQRTIAINPKLIATEKYENPGLLWGPGERIVGLGARRLTIWTTAGARLAHHVVK